MKLSEHFILRQIANTWVVVPLLQETINFNGMLTLNNSGAKLWRVLEKGADREQLAVFLTSEYDVNLEQALDDVDEFLNTLCKVGCIIFD